MRFSDPQIFYQYKSARRHRTNRDMYRGTATHITKRGGSPFSQQTVHRNHSPSSSLLNPQCNACIRTGFIPKFALSIAPVKQLILPLLFFFSFDWLLYISPFFLAILILLYSSSCRHTYSKTIETGPYFVLGYSYSSSNGIFPLPFSLLYYAGRSHATPALKQKILGNCTDWYYTNERD